eukprot:GEMP01037488.1.p1 GENE.GEMP01037488.1~~GEMP01037488.1.p1  ORF type:complete len:364 (+),score=120.91 GEMP01037488.1:2-1093(+)
MCEEPSKAKGSPQGEEKCTDHARSGGAEEGGKWNTNGAEQDPGKGTREGERTHEKEKGADDDDRLDGMEKTSPKDSSKDAESTWSDKSAPDIGTEDKKWDRSTEQQGWVAHATPEDACEATHGNEQNGVATPAVEKWYEGEKHVETQQWDDNNDWGEGSRNNGWVNDNNWGSDARGHSDNNWNNQLHATTPSEQWTIAAPTTPSEERIPAAPTSPMKITQPPAQVDAYPLQHACAAPMFVINDSTGGREHDVANMNSSADGAAKALNSSADDALNSTRRDEYTPVKHVGSDRAQCEPNCLELMIGATYTCRGYFDGRTECGNGFLTLQENDRVNVHIVDNGWAYCEKIDDSTFGYFPPDFLSS